MDPVVGTKQRILRIAAELFARYGYHGTGVSKLSEEAGLGRGALYYHIKSKESLLFEISHVYLQDVLSIARTVSELDIPPNEKLVMIGRAHMKNIAEHLAEWTVFFRELNVLSGSNRARVMRLRREYEAIWEELYAQGVKEGYFRKVDPIAMKGFLGMLNYSYLWIRPQGRLSPDTIADIFSDTFLTGILTPTKRDL